MEQAITSFPLVLSQPIPARDAGVQGSGSAPDERPARGDLDAPLSAQGEVVEVPERTPIRMEGLGSIEVQVVIVPAGAPFPRARLVFLDRTTASGWRAVWGSRAVSCHCSTRTARRSTNRPSRAVFARAGPRPGSAIPSSPTGWSAG